MRTATARLDALLFAGAIALVTACGCGGGDAAAPGPATAAGQTAPDASAAGAPTKGRFDDVVLDACLDRLDPAFQKELQTSPGPYDVNVTIKRNDAAATPESYKAVTRERIRELCKRADVAFIFPPAEHRGH